MFLIPHSITVVEYIQLIEICIEIDKIKLIFLKTKTYFGMMPWQGEDRKAPNSSCWIRPGLSFLLLCLKIQLWCMARVMNICHHPMDMHQRALGHWLSVSDLVWTSTVNPPKIWGCLFLIIYLNYNLYDAVGALWWRGKRQTQIKEQQGIRFHFRRHVGCLLWVGPGRLFGRAVWVVI